MIKMFHVKHQGGDLMDYTAVSQLVGSLGFPIVMCGMLFWKMVKQEEHYDSQVDKLNDTIINNTLAITKLIEKIGGKENE